MLRETLETIGSQGASARVEISAYDSEIRVDIEPIPAGLSFAWQLPLSPITRHQPERKLTAGSSSAGRSGPTPTPRQPGAAGRAPDGTASSR